MICRSLLRRVAVFLIIQEYSFTASHDSWRRPPALLNRKPLAVNVTQAILESENVTSLCSVVGIIATKWTGRAKGTQLKVLMRWIGDAQRKKCGAHGSRLR